MTKADDAQRTGASRRDFLKTSTAAAVGTTLAASMNAIPGAYAQGSDEIRVGVIGCGGRGTGAIRNVLDADKGVKIVALGDAFKDRLDKSLSGAKEKYGNRVDVSADRQFV